jgi:uncharacterized RDD family membrane protein YckC
VQPAEHVTIDTPEQIALELQVAGIGSRFLAIAVDTVLQVILYITVFVALSLAQVPDVLRTSFVGVAGPAVAILFGFSIYWGYFAAFEIFWSGRTPGKRLAGIRVIKETGRPINALEAIGRNVLRAIDFLPAGYAAGLVCMMLNKHSRRLGDYVAGTIVVHDKQTEDVRPDWNLDAQAPTGSAPISRITPEELQLIETYLHRRLDLDDDIRRDMAERIVARIAGKTGLQPPATQTIDDFLEGVARQIRDSARYR